MLGFSWSELLMVFVVAIVAIGPKQIPDVLYHMGRMARRLQYMRFALSKQFDDFMEKADLNDLKRGMTLDELSAHHQSIYNHEPRLITQSDFDQRADVESESDEHWENTILKAGDQKNDPTA